MKTILPVFFLIILLFANYSHSQIAISVGNPPAAIDFNSFTGSGFSTTPSIGQLNSNEWRVTGLSEGNGTFGGEHSTGDFARGISTGGVITGGIHSFEVITGNFSLGTQPGGTDMTPGTFVLRLQNVDNSIITDLSLSYKIWFYNDEDRSNSLNFEYSTDDVTYSNIVTANFTTPEAADPTPSWISVNRSVAISTLSVPQNGFIFIRWFTNDVSGSLNRDEIAIDDIVFESVLPVELSSFSAIFLDNAVKLIWRTETEVSNYGFEVERLQNYKIEKLQDWEKIGFVEGHGNSNSPKDYSFTDNSIGYGKYAYRLKQVDTDGQFEYSQVIEVDAGSIPGGFLLVQNYPNPFNPTTRIKFTLAETQSTKLVVYDVLGNEVIIPFNGTAEGGKVYEAEFSGKNLSSGIYFYRLETVNKVENRKMLLIK